jgi:hypothetical protein
VNRRVKDLFRALLGPSYSRGLQERARRTSVDLPARLQDTLDKISPEARRFEEQPVFIFSAGWRSGSTLLQRMIMEFNENIIIWGEPFDHSNIHDNMVNQFRSFTAQWPPERFFLSKTRDRKLSDAWVANLYPDVDDLVNAHRAYFDRLFRDPARALGIDSWGIKEVRLTISHANYFRMLYPNCKIIFLCRRPRDAYLSYRNLDAPWFRRWPDRLVVTPFAFGRQWAEMTQGFINGWQKIGALLIRYEDLDDPVTVKRIEEYLGWRVPQSTNMRKRAIGDVDEVGGGGEKKVELPWIDGVLLNLATGQTRKDAGY